jgi:hypothetical protein
MTEVIVSYSLTETHWFFVYDCTYSCHVCCFGVLLEQTWETRVPEKCYCGVFLSAISHVLSGFKTIHSSRDWSLTWKNDMKTKICTSSWDSTEQFWFSKIWFQRLLDYICFFVGLVGGWYGQLFDAGVLQSCYLFSTNRWVLFAWGFSLLICYSNIIYIVYSVNSSATF